MKPQNNKKENNSGEEVALVPTVEEKIPVVKQDFDIDGFLEMRKEFITKVNAIMVKGSDYHEIQGKKSLAKGGAEKIASIFGWAADFSKDEAVANAFSEVKGLISFVCKLTKNGDFVGEGRGAATLTKNGGDPNKTIKMAQKSAFIDAVLRASGLSDFFTQDLEDHPEHVQAKTYPQRVYQPRKVQPVQAEVVHKPEDMCEEAAHYKDQLMVCTDPKVYDQLVKTISSARNMGHIEQWEFNHLAPIAKAVYEKLTAK